MKAVVPAALDGERVDRIVSLLLGVSRAESTALVERGAVRLDDTVVAAGKLRASEGQTIDVDGAGREPTPPEPDSAIDVPVVHADDELIVVDKPAALVVHPGAGNPDGTLVNGLLARYPELAGVGDPARPGIVHRLDAGTSGLLVVARTPAAYESLVRQLATRRASRSYLALVWGEPEAPSGLIDAPIGRSAREPTKMAVAAGGRPARTRYRVQQRYIEPVTVTLLRCELETGRTHQIRVHLAAIGHPVVGDARYGGVRAGLDCRRPFLHATRLVIRQPATGTTLTFESPLPADLERVLAGLRPAA